MNLKDILSISGKGGLFKFISQGRTGIIVESFEDKKRTVVHSSAKVSALEDIAIFTDTEEVPLSDIFRKIYEKENGKETISHKSSSEELKTFMGEILPEYDKERVYVSDMKKLVQWYNLLIQMNLLKPEEEEKEKEEKEKKKEGKDEKTPANIKEKPKVTAKPKAKTVTKIKPSVKEKSVKTNIPRQKAK
ncbi:MAG: DUF5606 domain-containing protein [Bacteroidales bacterium]|nr:DUF5606 domain-containing protein [Bacteroidales bacterium]